MQCPKCQFEQDRKNIECVKCGLIFAKYQAALEAQSAGGQPDRPQPQQEKEPSITFSDIFFHIKEDNHILFVAGRGLVFLALIVWSVRFVKAPLESNYAAQSFWHLVNLPFHEAGHIVFRPFGAFITSLGGTLGQLLMPLVCSAVLLLKTRDTFGASATLWWFGQNFFDIAPYINDARSLSLPLLGGNVGHSSPYGFHDWEYLLTEAGLLRYDHFLAKTCQVTGTLIFFTALAWGGFILYKQYRNLS